MQNGEWKVFTIEELEIAIFNAEITKTDHFLYFNHITVSTFDSNKKENAHFRPEIEKKMTIFGAEILKNDDFWPKNDREWPSVLLTFIFTN